MVGGSDWFVVFEVEFRFYLPDCYWYFWRIQLSFYYLFVSLFVRKSRFVFVFHCFKCFTSIFLYSSSEWSNLFFWKPVGSLCSHRNVWSLGGGSAFPETSFHHRCYRGVLSSRIGDINPRHGVLILLVIGVVRVVFFNCRREFLGHSSSAEVLSPNFILSIDGSCIMLWLLRPRRVMVIIIDTSAYPLSYFYQCKDDV